MIQRYYRKALYLILVHGKVLYLISTNFIINIIIIKLFRYVCFFDIQILIFKNYNFDLDSL